MSEWSDCGYFEYDKNQNNQKSYHTGKTKIIFSSTSPKKVLFLGQIDLPCILTQILILEVTEKCTFVASLMHHWNV